MVGEDPEAMRPVKPWRQVWHLTKGYARRCPTVKEENECCGPLGCISKRQWMIRGGGVVHTRTGDIGMHVTEVLADGVSAVHASAFNE